MINIGMCFLDAIFNLLLIFPTATYKILGLSITVPGADLGVAGAALGTILAESVSTFCFLVLGCKVRQNCPRRPPRLFPS